MSPHQMRSLDRPQGNEDTHPGPPRVTQHPTVTPSWPHRSASSHAHPPAARPPPCRMPAQPPPLQGLQFPPTTIPTPSPPSNKDSVARNHTIPTIGCQTHLRPLVRARRCTQRHNDCLAHPHSAFNVTIAPGIGPTTPEIEAPPPQGTLDPTALGCLIGISTTQVQTKGEQRRGMDCIGST